MKSSLFHRLLAMLIFHVAGIEVTKSATMALPFCTLLFVKAYNRSRNYSRLVIASLKQEKQDNLSKFTTCDLEPRHHATRICQQVSIQLQLIKKRVTSLGVLLLIVVSCYILFGEGQQAMSISTDDKIVELEQRVRKKQEVGITSQRAVLTKARIEQANAPKLPYWKAQMSDNPFDVVTSNQKLFDEVFRLITTNYYDHTGGFNFAPKDFFLEYKKVFYADGKGLMTKGSQRYFDSRKHAVEGLKFMVNMINDPYSRYLTRQELQNELSLGNNDGFLGIGAVVSVETRAMALPTKKLSMPLCDVTGLGTLLASAGECGGEAFTKYAFLKKSVNNNSELIKGLLSPDQVANLPLITAVEPFSPAERSGIVVGDRIVSIGSLKFLGLSSSNVIQKIKTTYMGAENYFGFLNIIIAKPIFKEELQQSEGDIKEALGRQLIGYKQSHVKIITKSLEPFEKIQKHFDHGEKNLPLSGGNSICFWQLLTPANSIVYISKPNLEFTAGQRLATTDKKNAVGYIRLTRFSRSSTLGFLQAVQNLESLGAQSYIIDVRNNYGGVIQEAMLTASSLLRDPHYVLCFTLNSRGGFVPHTVEEYVIDERYPGYLLSSESLSVTMDLVRNYSPKYLNKDSGWSPPSQYASLHEQSVKRGIKSSNEPSIVASRMSAFASPLTKALKKEKKIVILVNEGTASSAEVFASSLHDNGRLVALVGAKTYGKGLIQHTFPTPDGGGLRLTVAEYLTPKLKHVTNVGGARFSVAGKLVGGGVKPDIYCETKGIPKNPGADLCVGIALDALD